MILSLLLYLQDPPQDEARGVVQDPEDEPPDKEDEEACLEGADAGELLLLVVW